MAATSQSPESLYGTDFHADRDARTRATARKVLGSVFEWLSPQSVCDVGCGTGTWLAAASELGIETIQGFEGPWAKTANLVVSDDAVDFQDLENSVSGDRTFDLVISLEVAEHLSDARSAGFVKDLCNLGDCIMFSAAIPLQGGTGHITERWQSHWAKLFEAEGYSVYDPVRPLIWDDGEVAFWYRQNTMVYVRRGSEAETKIKAAGFGAPVMLDLVHPDQYMHAETSQPGRAIKRSLRKILGRS